MNSRTVGRLRNGQSHRTSMTSTRSVGGLRPRSPSHAAKNKTPEDRVCEFGWMLTQREGRLMCRACNLNLDHTRRSTIVEHLRSRKHQRFLEESELDLVSADASTVTPIVLMEICEDENSQNNTQSSSDRRSTQSSPTPVGMAGPYLLKKETHCSTILDQLLRDDTFSDVTLTAEGQSIRAHKIVLCLASAYFRQVLSKDSTVQNVIVFRDIKFSELRNLINFIYTGEATVDASDLESFMKTAEMLEVNSLSDGQRNIPKSFLPRAREMEPERPPRGPPSFSKRSQNAGASSPPSKSRRTNDGVSPPPRTYKQTFPTTLASGPPVPPIVQFSSPVIKTEPKSEDMILEEDFPTQGEEEEVYDNHERSPSQPHDPGQSPPLDRLEDTSSDKAPPGRCPFCPFSQPIRKGTALTKHLYACHPDKTVFSCDICSRAFLKESAYEAHKDDCR